MGRDRRRLVEIYERSRRVTGERLRQALARGSNALASRLRSCSWPRRRRAALVARPELAARSATRSRPCAGSGSSPRSALNLALGRRALDRVADGDRRRRCRRRIRATARLLGVLGRALRERRAARAGSASSRASPCSTRKLPTAQGHVGDARRHGLRASRLRPRARSCCSIVYVLADREDPALGDHEPRGRSSASASRLFAFAFASARASAPLRRSTGSARVRRIVTMARQGLGVMRSPVGAAVAILFQSLGWICQLLAVWAAMRAFHIHAPLPAAGLVLAADERRDDLPALAGERRARPDGDRDAAARSYGVAYARGVAFGFGLQAIEASVGIGVGLLFLAREGLSFAMLQVMPSTPTRRRWRPGGAAARSREPDARWRARLASRASSRRATRRPRSRRASRTRRRLRRAAGRGRRRGNASTRSRDAGGGGTDGRDPLGRPARRAGSPAGRTAVVESAQATPARARAARPLRASSRGFGELISPRARGGAAARRPRRDGDGGRRARDCARCSRAAGADAVLCDVRSPLLDARPRLFGAAEGRDAGAGRGARAARSPRRGSRPMPRCPAAGAAGGLGAAFAALGAELVPGARRARPARLRPARLRPRRHGGGTRRRDHRRREGARRGRAALRSRPVSVRRLRRRRRAAARRRRNDRALGRPGRGPPRTSLELGLRLGRACSTRRASSSILPCAPSSFSRQNA